jgi:tight adherence protein B
VQLTNTRHTSGFFILLAVVLSLFGHLVTNVITGQFALSVVLAAILGITPFFYLVRKKKERMEKLLRQLPDALELIARALRAGHSFTTGMKLAADEFDDPIGPEFRETLDEINFGVGVTDAMKNLANRLDCPDLKYFVVSVIIQRETGGNLAEIMDSLSYLIRERFKFKGKIRVLSAEGKLSALILVLLPVFLVIVLCFIAPKYIEILIVEPVGRLMAVVATCLMVSGVFAMKRIINISV